MVHRSSLKKQTARPKKVDFAPLVWYDEEKKEGDTMPNMRETTNIIIALRREGWKEEKINDFMVFIETNAPTAEQAQEAKENNKNS